jgi:hypothetical protein
MNGMMKLNAIAFGLLMIASCSTNNKASMDDVNDIEIVRNQFQRGRVESQTINSKKTILIVNNDTIEKATNKETWQKVKGFVDKLDLNNLVKLSVAENAKAHQSDGSAAVNIKINSDQKESQSPTYDKGKAPKEIYELDKFLESLSK